MDQRFSREERETWRFAMIGIWACTDVGAAILRFLARERTFAIFEPSTAGAILRKLTAAQRAKVEQVVVGKLDTLAEAGSRHAERTMRRWQARQLVRWTDAALYPPRLNACSGAPPVLEVRGDPLALAAPMVAVVGTRRASEIGLVHCRTVVRHLAERNLGVVSGGAYGVDSMAHRTALQCGQTTVWIAGRGIDRMYPAANRDLAAAIVDAGGAVASQWHAGCEARPFHFPRRNEVIAGLGIATIGLDLPEKSGAEHTLKAARRYQRRVWMVPAAPFDKAMNGGNRLIAKGHATLLHETKQLDELVDGSARRAVSSRAQIGLFDRAQREGDRRAGGRGRLSSNPAQPPTREVAERSANRGDALRGAAAESPRPVCVDARQPRATREEAWPDRDDARRLRARLLEGATHVDALSELFGSGVHGLLLELELEGLIERAAGATYRLA